MDTEKYTELWKEICFLLSEKVKPDILEKEFEDRVIRVFEKLGWSEFLGEIQQQPIIQMGKKKNIRPDLVICGPDKAELIVAEIKRPTEDLSKDESIGQLKSYIRQYKADFGLLIGNEIRMYYDGPLIPKKKDPSLLDKIPFEKAAKNGSSFVAIFNKQDFLNLNYEPHLKKLIDNFKAKKNIKKLRIILSKNETKDKILAFLKEEYNEFGSEIVNEALNDLTLTLSFKSIAPPIAPPLPPTHKKPKTPTATSSGSFTPGKTILNLIQANPDGIKKSKISEITGQSYHTVTNSLYRYLKKVIILNKGRGIYMPISSDDKPDSIINVASVEMNGIKYQIEQYSSSTLKVLNMDSNTYEPELPLLKKIIASEKLGIKLATKSGPKKTRYIGYQVIKKLKAQQ